RGEKHHRHLLGDARTAGHHRQDLRHERWPYRGRDGLGRGLPGEDHARHRAGGRKGIMTTDTARPAEAAPPVRSTAGMLTANLRDYGLVLALIAIMVFFQFTTNGVLFKPVNLTNVVLQNSYIVIMALGMLLVIVAGHIDL